MSRVGSASPNIEFFRTILGIDSDAPGFNKVKIEPVILLGKFENIQGEIPHPMGKIGARYLFENGKWKVQIDLPKKTSGHLIWQDKSYPLNEGQNDFFLTEKNYSVIFSTLPKLYAVQIIRIKNKNQFKM